VPGIPLREDADVVQGGQEDWQQAMNPVARLGLTQAEEFTQDTLEGGRFSSRPG
jgi:hypothetical protein